MMGGRRRAAFVTSVLVLPISSKKEVIRDTRGGVVEVVMIDWLVATNGGVVPLILRLTLAVVMFPHGAQKTLGWFGGYGFWGNQAALTKFGLPPAPAILFLVASFFGPLRLGDRP